MITAFWAQGASRNSRAAVLCRRATRSLAGNDPCGVTLVEIMTVVLLGSISLGVLWAVFFSVSRQNRHGERQASLARLADVFVAVLREDIRSTTVVATAPEALTLHLSLPDTAGIPREQIVTWTWNRGRVLRQMAGRQPRIFDFGSLVGEEFTWSFTLQPAGGRNFRLGLTLRFPNGQMLLDLHETLSSGLP